MIGYKAHLEQIYRGKFTYLLFDIIIHPIYIYLARYWICTELWNTVEMLHWASKGVLQATMKVGGSDLCYGTADIHMIISYSIFTHF